MNNTFEIMKAYTGNYEIKVYKDDECILDIIVNDYNVEGACEILKALGYQLLRDCRTII